LDQRVGDDRRRVRQQRHRGRVDPMAPEPLAEPVDDRLGKIARRRRHLGDADVPGLLVDEGHIGKRPADIDSDPPRHR
jgi:hypothetical protein